MPPPFSYPFLFITSVFPFPPLSLPLFPLSPFPPSSPDFLMPSPFSHPFVFITSVFPFSPRSLPLFPLSPFPPSSPDFLMPPPFSHPFLFITSVFPFSPRSLPHPGFPVLLLIPTFFSLSLLTLLLRLSLSRLFSIHFLLPLYSTSTPLFRPFCLSSAPIFSHSFPFSRTRHFHPFFHAYFLPCLPSSLRFGNGGRNLKIQFFIAQLKLLV